MSSSQNPSRKRLTILISALVLLALITLPYELFDEKIRRKLISMANNADIHLDIKEFDLRFPAQAAFRGLSFSLGAIPIGAEQGHICLHLVNLLWLQTKLSGEASTLGGEATFAWANGLLTKKRTLTVQAHELLLEAHPAFYYAGIAGKLTLNFDGELANQQPQLLGVRRAQIRAHITNGNIREEIKEFSPFLIPEVDNLELTVALEQEGARFRIKEANSSSSLGSIVARGFFALSKALLINDLEFNGEIKLSETGVKAFAGYLELAAGLEPEGKIASWKFSIFNDARRGVQFVATPTTR